MSLFSSSYISGGMALEGCLILPLFILFILSILLSMEMVRLQSNMQEAVHQAVNELAFQKYDSLYGKKGITDVDAMILDYIEKLEAPFLCVEDGKAGITIRNLSDETNSEKIEIVLECKLKPIIGILPLEGKLLTDRLVSHGWTGYRGDKGEGETGVKVIYVYITETGSKYHLEADCVYLRVVIRPVEARNIESIRNEAGEKYYACERCSRESEGIYYITSYGNRYHNKADCPSLRRTVYIVPLPEAEGRTSCSKCG